MSSNDFITVTITEFIRSLDPNKAPDCDRISKRILKLCAVSISKPLHIIFNNSVMNECFPNEWKKVNIILVHKRDEKQIVKNTDLCHSCLFVARFLRKLSLIVSLNI